VLCNVPVHGLFIYLNPKGACHPCSIHPPMAAPSSIQCRVATPTTWRISFSALHRPMYPPSKMSISLQQSQSSSQVGGVGLLAMHWNKGERHPVQLATFHSSAHMPSAASCPCCSPNPLILSCIPSAMHCRDSCADVGIWHPLAPSMYEDLKEYLNWCAACFLLATSLFPPLTASYVCPLLTPILLQV
jgi:hypothetical protein